MTDTEYRRTPVKLRARIRIIKNHLRRKDYAFVTSAQFSKAMYKYRAAFMRNNAERCAAFMKQVKKGETSAQHWGGLSRTVIPVLSIVSVPRRPSQSVENQIIACDFHATDELHGDRPPF